MATKIVLIGAGSTVFTQGLVADLIQTPELGPWEVRLVDIDPDALEVAQALVQRMVDFREADIQVSASTDRTDVLPGSDVVVTTIAVGGRRGWQADVVIPRKYGVYQPVGDSVMPGGISRAQRMIPAMLAIAQDVHKCCPQARFFNYSNPMTAICRAIRKATAAQVVGLCHGTMHTEGSLAQFAGIPHAEMTSLALGLNHLTWIYDLRWKGRDAWPLVRARMAEEQGESIPQDVLELYPDLTDRPENAPRAADQPFSWQLFEQHGAFPAPGDRHTVEFFPERFPGGQYGGKTLGIDVYSIEGTIEGGDRGYQAMRERALGNEPLATWLFERSSGEHEQLVEMLLALDQDTREVFAVNVPNQGAVAGLPDDAVLEISAAATARGFSPLQVQDPPQSLVAILNRLIATQELTVEAALTGERRLFVEAILADGALTDASAATQMVDELIEAHRDHLPQYQ